jgi:hypothetical protein
MKRLLSPCFAGPSPSIWCVGGEAFDGSSGLASEEVLTPALVHPFLRPGYVPLGPEEQRRRALSHSTSTVLVAALHLLFFFFFVFAVHPFDMRTRPIIETILTLPLAGNNQPRKDVENPQPLTNAPPRILSAPITVPKPPPVKPEVEKNNAGESNAPTDVLGAVGRELACSAGSWEHLSSAERERCGHGRTGGYPWKGVRLPNGSIVMVPRTVLPRLADAPPDTGFTINSGADRVQADVQRGVIPGAGGCPILQNTPCLHVAPGMRDATGQN